MNATKRLSSCHHFDLKNIISKNVLKILNQDCKRLRTFDPITTFNCFLYQALTQSSCKAAITYLNLNRAKTGLKLISMNTAAYTKAKQRLCVIKLRSIAIQTGQSLEDKSSQWKWNNRNIYLIDGTVLQLEDTKKNTEKYPVSKYNGKQLGQPKLRLLGVFGHSTGALIDAEISSYSGKGQGETTLLKRMLSRFEKNSILVLDRYFTSYFLQDLFKKNELDYVIRARDEMAKKYLKNKSDIRLNLQRPKQSLDHYDVKDAALEIEMRIIKSTIERKGFRVATIYILSSLLETPKKEIEYLYLQRWKVEDDIRNLKCTLEAGMLKSKSPEIVEKELWINLIAYNLVRKVNCAVAFKEGVNAPRKFSFKAALKAYVIGLKILGVSRIEKIISLLKKEILNSPYRREPRAIKKRHNRYRLLTATREGSKKMSWSYATRCGKNGKRTPNEASLS